MRTPVVSLIAAAAATALAATPAAAAPTTYSALGAQDRAFVLEASQGGLFEVTGGKLAMRLGVDPRAKAFGQRMVSDHAKAGAELAAIANRLRVPVATAPGAEQQRILALWATLSGPAFDCSYVPSEYLDHIGDIASFEKEAGSGRNARLRAYAREQLPTLNQHKQMAAADLAGLSCTR